EAIIDPSKEIKEGFQTYRLTTTDSKVFVGLKIKEDAKEVVIRDSSGRDHRVAKEDVESLAASKLSLMPDNAVSQLTYDQFIDLLAFLKSKPAQESLRGLAVEAMVAGVASADMKVTKPEGGFGLAWKPLAAGADGQFDLSSTFEAPKTAAAYVRVYVYSPKAQKATVTVEAGGPWLAWVNEATAASSGPMATELKEGWNVLLVKVSAGKPATLGVRVSGDGLRTAARSE
ncbi:MAG: hypothetical protein K2V38_01350, partial [Gemmataceae bacterium]|nr:hypothetical protein [Gemmataceae bacterium]